DPPEDPPDPQGPGPPVFQGMGWDAPVMCRPEMALRGWRTSYHTPYAASVAPLRDGEAHIHRREEVCKRMSTGGSDTPSPETLRAALRAVMDPASGQDIVAAGLI